MNENPFLNNGTASIVTFVSLDYLLKSYIFIESCLVLSWQLREKCCLEQEAICDEVHTDERGQESKPRV